jgi:GNAT superfamily N-acetyltransferase
MHDTPAGRPAPGPIGWTAWEWRAPPAAPGDWVRGLVRLRRLQPADHAALAAHWLALPSDDRQARFGAALGEAAIRRHAAGLDLDGGLGWGAFEPEGAMVGAALGFACGPGRVEVAVSVAPARRGRGLGATLVAAVCGTARAQGRTEALFEVAAGNGPMRALLRHLGVRPAPGDGTTVLPLTLER